MAHLMAIISCCNVILMLIYFNGCSCNASDKRILLNSEQDLLQKVIDLEAKVANLSAELQTVKSDQAVVGRGSTYVRWGRNVCPDHAELVYKGYTSGRHYFDHGSGTSNVCLPDDPKWGKFHETNDGLRAHIYGSEIDYEAGSHVFPYDVNQEDMPCVVCKTERSMSLVVPARNECYPGWTVEYTGYLMAGVQQKSAAAPRQGYDYLCMDGEPEFLQHGATNDDEHVLYLVDAQCGSLPCPPYIQGRELTCIVCSK